MFFILAKTLAHFERPGEALVMALAAGLGLAWFVRTRRIGLVLASLATFCLVAIAVLPIADWIAAPLENRFPRPARLPDHVDGLIVLGGAVDPATTLVRGIPTLNADAERMTAFVALAKLYPTARLVFSGGSGLMTPPPLSEAQVARLFFRQQGLDVSRVIFEDRSRDTYENVLFSKQLVKPRPGERWILVSSAEDVPRSMGIFTKLGWPVMAMPVAYKTNGASDISLAGNLGLLDHAMHEWLGLLAYRLAGRTDRLFPGPQSP
jgi:uncharacterized SAM-binding protein YcdF (DUF218 family)